MVEGLISVIMTNYNTHEECLKEAINSILCQTYSNFEFIIVDDCSTDKSLEVIKTFKDDRIRLLINEENVGLTKSLNRALEISNGEYIARMDSDDISEPTRFEKQVEFLKNNSNVIVCGTWVRLFGDWKEEGYSHEIICRKIPDRETYQIMLLFGNYPNIVHPSAMFQSRLLQKYNIKYNENYRYAQDYRMWVECSKYAECAIVPNVLLNYRVHRKAITSCNRTQQMDCTLNIMKEQLSELGLELNVKYHTGFLNKRYEYDLECLEWIKKILEHNSKVKKYNQHKLKKLLYKKWSEIVYFNLRECDVKEKVRRIKTIPLRYYPELFNIWFARKMR